MIKLNKIVFPKLSRIDVSRLTNVQQNLQSLAYTYKVLRDIIFASNLSFTHQNVHNELKG